MFAPLSRREFKYAAGLFVALLAVDLLWKLL
jgi:hypothetical protein